MYRVLTNVGEETGVRRQVYYDGELVLRMPSFFFWIDDLIADLLLNFSLSSELPDQPINIYWP